MHTCKKRLSASNLLSQLVQRMPVEKKPTYLQPLLTAGSLYAYPKKKILPASNLPSQPVQHTPMKKGYRPPTPTYSQANTRLQPSLKAGPTHYWTPTTPHSRCNAHLQKEKLPASNLPSQPVQLMPANKEYQPPTTPHSQSNARL